MLPQYSMEKLNKPRKILQYFGLYNDRNLYWTYYEPRNFGDWIGPYLFHKITGKKPIHASRKVYLLQKSYMSVGSSLRKFKCRDRFTVWGSGIISTGDVFARPRSISSVRGPYTRKRCQELGYDCPEIFGDPAILMPKFYTPKIDRNKRYKLGIIPHHMQYEDVRAEYEENDDVCIIDVGEHLEDVIDKISSCECTVSASLHGLIVSHTYNVPSGWVEFSRKLMGDGVKYHDYLDSAGTSMNAKPLNLHETKDVSELIGFARDFPIPNLASLQEPLLEACPFR